MPFTGRLLSEEFSAARLAFNYLQGLAEERGEPSRLAEFEKFFPFVAIADDHDRWIHQVPESADWALAVQTLGGVDSFREIAKLTEPVMSRRMRVALEAGKKAMDKSLRPRQRHYGRAAAGQWLADSHRLLHGLQQRSGLEAL